MDGKECVMIANPTYDSLYQKQTNVWKKKKNMGQPKSLLSKKAILAMEETLSKFFLSPLSVNFKTGRICTWSANSVIKRRRDSISYWLDVQKGNKRSHKGPFVNVAENLQRISISC